MRTGKTAEQKARREQTMSPDPFLLPDETVEDLERSNYRIIQKKSGFRFGMDAVLLSGFARAFRGERVLDLGCGSGIIPLLLSAKTEGEHFTGLEIQEEFADMAARSVRLNGLEDTIDICTGDIREASRLFGRASFDVVTSNPPYMIGGHGISSPDRRRAIAREEVLCTLDELVRETALVLRPGGRFYLVHRPFRLAEIITSLKACGLEPKRMKMVHPFSGKEANMVLLEAVRGGQPRLTVEAPVIVFQAPGIYSDEIKGIYGY